MRKRAPGVRHQEAERMIGDSLLQQIHERGGAIEFAIAHPERGETDPSLHATGPDLVWRVRRSSKSHRQTRSGSSSAGHPRPRGSVSTSGIGARRRDRHRAEPLDLPDAQFIGDVAGGKAGDAPVASD